ncbi:hypothetical protein Tco_0227721 [Tanacetum coccineum]
MQNNFLEDYFEGLNENKDRKKNEMVRIEEDMNSTEVHTFHEFVAFLNLIKNDELVSKGWDLYRDRFVKQGHRSSCQKQMIRRRLSLESSPMGTLAGHVLHLLFEREGEI